MALGRDLSWHLQVDLSQLQRLVMQLGGSRTRIKQQVNAAVNAALVQGVREAQQNVSGRIIKRRTGLLANSISKTQEWQGERLIGRLGIIKPREARVLKYAAALEYGAVAVPTPGLTFLGKPRKLLAIPTPLNQTKSGAQRLTPEQAYNQYSGWTRWFGTRQGWELPTLVAIRRGRGGRAAYTPLFWGKKRVLIAGGPGVGFRYLRNALDRIQQPLVIDLVTRTLRTLQGKNTPTTGAATP